MVSLRTALRQKMIPTLPTPASGEMSLGFETDGILYQRNSAGTKLPVGNAGPAGPQGPTGAAGVGNEMGYTERQTNFFTTNTTAYSLVSTSIISGLTTTVVGTGRAVDIEFYCCVAQHSVASTYIGAYLITNGATNNAFSQLYASPVNTIATLGGAILMKRRLILVSGTSYAFTVGIYGSQAGTVTVAGSTNQPMSLAVTQR